MAVTKPKKKAKPIAKTVGKGGNYRSTKSGAGKTRNDPNSRIRQARRRWKC